MGIVKQSSLLRGFTPGIGSQLRLAVAELALEQSWAARSYHLLGSVPPPAEANFTRAVVGSARLERDRLTVIGSDEHSTQSVDWILHEFTDDQALRRSWHAMLPDSPDNDLLGPMRGGAVASEAERRLRRYIRLRYRELDLRPPTALVGFYAPNWQLGDEKRWFVNCHVVHDVFSNLWSDVRDGHDVRVSCSVALCPDFVDSKYSYGVLPKTFGVLRNGEFSCARGWLESLSWTVARQHGHKDEASA